jgi:hypothetical protein
MVIEPVGEWEHSAYQSDNQFVVEVRQKRWISISLARGLLQHREAVTELSEHRFAFITRGVC